MSVAVAASMTRGQFTLSASLTVENGECVAVLGRNGSGKSTLFLAIAGLLRCSTGSISINQLTVDNAEHPRVWVAPERRHVGFLPQGGALFPHLSVLRNVQFGLRAHGVAQHESTATSLEMLSQFGIESLAQRLPHELSGGQRQRVALARTLVLQPHVLLLDEPTVALDTDGRTEVLSVISDIRHRFSGPILFTSHDERDVSLLASREITVHASTNDGYSTSTVSDTK